MPPLHSIFCRVTHQFISVTTGHTAYTVCVSQKLRQTAGCDLTRLSIKEAFPFRGFGHMSVRARAALWGEQPGPEAEITDEQEYMLRTVLRNQEVIMNALADLLTGNPRGRVEEQHRDKDRKDHQGGCSAMDQSAV